MGTSAVGSPPGACRSSFISRSAGLALAVYGASALGPQVFEDGIAAAQTGADDPVLVSAFLSGGVDSLSLLAPTGHARYAQLRPTLALTTVLCVTGSLLAFEQFYILTKGGPDNSTVTIVQLIYSVAFQGQNNLGRAAALSVIVLLALVVINAIQFKGLKGDDQ